LSLWIVFKDFEIDFKISDLEEIKYHLKEGWYIFISSIMSTFYRNSNSFLLGLLTSNIMVGYYVIAEKILYSIQNIQGVIGSALYPHFSLKFKSQINQFIILTKKYIRIILSIYFLIALSLFIFSKDLVVLISGKDIFEVNLILKIISSVVVIGGMNYYFGILGLISLKHDDYFSKCIMYTGIFNIILSIFLIKFFNIFGAAISLVMSEFFLLTLILSKIYKLNIESNSNIYE
jgi:PST family polysaccharide transporter